MIVADRFLGATLSTAAENVALDEALLLEAEERGGPSLLRAWELDRLAVVMGASCRIRDNVLIEACRQDGVEIARRSSGGGTVVIGSGALNVSIILPIQAAPELQGVVEAQRYVLSRILEAIRRSGVPAAEMHGSGDLTLGGRKFSGSAQRRLRHHVLVHASLLYDFPLEAIGRYTHPPPPSAGLSSRPGSPELRDEPSFGAGQTRASRAGRLAFDSRHRGSGDPP